MHMHNQILHTTFFERLSLFAMLRFVCDITYIYILCFSSFGVLCLRFFFLNCCSKEMHTTYKNNKQRKRTGNLKALIAFVLPFVCIFCALSFFALFLHYVLLFIPQTVWTH